MGFLRRPQNLKKSLSYFWQERRFLCVQQLTWKKVDEDFFFKCGQVVLYKLYNTTCPHFKKKNLRRLFDKYAVVRTEHDALVKSTTKIFSNFVAFSENPNFIKIATLVRISFFCVLGTYFTKYYHKHSVPPRHEWMSYS